MYDLRVWPNKNELHGAECRANRRGGETEGTWKSFMGEAYRVTIKRLTIALMPKRADLYDNIL